MASAHPHISEPNDESRHRVAADAGGDNEPRGKRKAEQSQGSLQGTAA